LAEEDFVQIGDTLQRYSPAVEDDIAASLFYIDAGGLSRLYESEGRWSETVLAAVGQPARLGLAGGKFAAWLAARTVQPQTGYQVAAQDRSFLAPLPLHWLPLSAEAQRRLRLLGLSTIGHFAAWREVQVLEQLGPGSVVAHRWARGLDERPVQGRCRQMAQAYHTFEAPEGRHEALLEATVRLAQRALRDLPPPQAAWAIKRVSLEAILVNGEVFRRSCWLGAAPLPQTLRPLLAGMLGDLRGAGMGVDEVGICLLGWDAAAGRQLNLFDHTGARAQMEQTLQELADKHSPGCVMQADLLDARAPLSAERFGLRAYRL